MSTLNQLVPSTVRLETRGHYSKCSEPVRERQEASTMNTINQSVPSTVRFLGTSSVSTILPVPVLKYDASQMYIPPSLHLAWLMVSEMKFWEMLPSTVPVTELPEVRLGFPLFWSDPAATTSARGALGLLCNTRKMIKLSKVRTPVDGGSHFTVTVPPMDVVLGVRFSCVGVTVILACP